ncbi:MAG TPA: PilN domain-containing protein [Candidatus Angelobacter sp.]|nr:PilN domain-containing protein [Candidatus Angelobacter sp.]
MRLNINLASHPYQDAGDFYRRWGAALGLLILVTLTLIAIAVHEWMSTRSISVQIASIHKQMDDLDDVRNQAQAILNRPENRGTRDRSAFVNGLIEVKSFSWSEVFADMETLMPTRVHLVSIKPELDKEDQIEVTITAAGDSREKGFELQKNMEKSRYFSKAAVKVESSSQQAQPGGDTWKFELVAYYVPQLHVPRKEKSPHSSTPAMGSSARAGHGSTRHSSNRRNQRAAVNRGPGE